MLKRKNFSSFHELLKISEGYPDRQNKIIEAAQKSELHSIYNDLAKKILELTNENPSKTFLYVKAMSDVYVFL